MTRPLALAVLAASLLAQAVAQETTPSAKAPSIAGTVVSEPGNHPLRKVIVELVAEDQREGDRNYSGATDNEGRFEIDSVAPGRYRLFLERTGFAEVNTRGQRADVNIVTVQPSKRVDGLVLHMLSAAALTGRVTDEDGDPMPDVRVVAQRKLPGRNKYETAGVAPTNDLGEYRLANLFPGQFRVAAMPPPDFRDYEGAQNQAKGSDKTETRYLTTYYPGTYDSEQASTVSLKAGDEMPIDVTMVPARTYHVRGMVTGVTAGQTPVVDVTSKNGDAIRASEVEADGEFEVRGVAPGKYVVRASSGSDSSTLTAQQEITVEAADVEGVKLTPVPSFRLAGHLRVEGQISNLSLYGVSLRSRNPPDNSGFFVSGDAFGMNASVDRQGNFEWKNVSPGSYVVQLVGGDNSQDWFLKSTRIGDRDIEGGFSANGPAVLDLVMSTRAARIDGVVTERNQNGNDVPVSNVTVVAVPDEKSRKVAAPFNTGATDQYGHYTIRGLAPGSYALYAWQDLSDNVFRDPEFLQSQEGNGVAAKVEEGSRKRFDLRLSPVGGEWR